MKGGGPVRHAGEAWMENKVCEEERQSGEWRVGKWGTLPLSVHVFLKKLGCKSIVEGEASTEDRADTPTLGRPGPLYIITAEMCGSGARRALAPS